MLGINIFNHHLSNPLFLPSGIINEIGDHKLAFKGGAGCVVLKSITIEPREGNPFPRVVKVNHGFINSVGLRNKGLTKSIGLICDFIKTHNKPVIVSVFANKRIDFERLVNTVVQLKPFAIELNLSCPNVEDEYGSMVSLNNKISGEIVKASVAQANRVPIITKLTPNTINIGELASVCEQAGASAISAINTVASGMFIDIKTKKPVLGMKKGGLSGPAIKPIAIAKVYEIYERVKIPILGMGGVSTVEDVIEMMMAGATMVGIGSAVYSYGYGIFHTLLEGLNTYIETNKLNSISELIGIAHEK